MPHVSAAVVIEDVFPVILAGNHSDSDDRQANVDVPIGDDVYMPDNCNEGKATKIVPSSIPSSVVKKPRGERCVKMVIEASLAPHRNCAFCRSDTAAKHVPLVDSKVMLVSAPAAASGGARISETAM